jgi:hypothetical protein
MTVFTRHSFKLLLVLSLLTFSGVVLAQEVTGSISGTITDPSGATVKSATVTLTNTDRGQDVRTLTTGNSGFFTATSLPLGTYTVKVVAPGFQTDSVTGLVLHANDALTVNRKLVIGSSEQQLTVTADAVQLNLENGISQGLISGTQVRELVLNNRNYEQLLQLQPGVAYGGASDQLYVGVSLPAGTSNQVSFSVNGQRATANNWTVDGADNVDRGANLTLLSFPSIDAIAEVKTLRGTYTAEYGRSASGQVNVVTRSGTNGLHGSAYEFFRNDLFNANGYFNNLNKVSRPLLRYNDFGYSIGGPVYLPKIYDGRDKTFFFVSQEFRRVINYALSTVAVPTSAERNGDFSNSYLVNASGGYTGATGPVAVCAAYASNGACTAYSTKLASISPTAAAYLKDIYAGVPLPNSALDLATGQDPHNYSYNARNVFNDNQTFVRIDQALGQKANIFYRYLHDTFPSQEANGLFITAIGMPGVQNTDTNAPGTQHLGHVTYTFTPTLLLDAGYAYSSGAILSTPVGLVAAAHSPDIKPTLPFAPNLGVVPTITIANAAGVSSAGIYNDFNRNHNVFGNVTKIWGLHAVKWGITYNHYQKMENVTGNASPYPQGNFAFTQSAAPTAAQQAAAGGASPSPFDNSFANFLIGNANGGYTQGSAALIPNIQENLFEGYVQDDWKVNPRLTINAGVRYSYFGQPTDGNNRLSNFDPATYVAANAPTIASNGTLCIAAPCLNVNHLNSGVPNANADSLNGIIFGTPGSVTNGHASPFGAAVGSTQKYNFAPRVGFAFDVFGDGKTSFRGGYGIAYDESAVSIYETAIFNNPPFVDVQSYTTANFDDPAAGTASVNLAPPSLAGSPVTYKTPYVQQYSLDVQQAITPTLLLDVGYFGDLGTHLQGKVDINEIQPGAFAAAGIPYNNAGGNGVAGCNVGFTSQTCEQQLNQIRPYKGYTAINTVRTIFSSNYNGLQVKVQKKFSGKSYVDANYTWSKALTNATADYTGGPQNTYNINAGYGRAAIDRTNIITLDGVYELPWYRDQKGLVGRAVGGWELSAIYAINSGLPLTITESASATNVVNYSSGSGANVGAQTSVLNPKALNGGPVTDSGGLGILGPSASGLRPSQVLDPNNGYGGRIHTRLNWFYRPAFVAPSPASFGVGDEKTGVVNGPGFNRLDVGIFRNFRIFNDLVFQLRGEAFNAANHTNWQGVGTTASSASTFGQVTSTRDARILQVAGKITF